ncbi:MAG: hypothetical protein AABY64_10860 [Bdellovibrionota bacterium]
MLLFYFRISIGALVAKILIFKHGLRVNCLLNRYPLVWIQPNLIECVHLARLKEHGFQISATAKAPTNFNKKEHFISSSLVFPGLDKQKALLRPPKKFNQLLEAVIHLAEKDLLEL